MKRLREFRVVERPVYSLHDAALALLDDAIAALKLDRSDEVVHAARKGAKQVRAALRLMRLSIGVDAYHRENRRVRDAAKPLTPVRDAFMLRHTLNHMPQRPAKMRRAFEADHEKQRRTLEGKGWRVAVSKLQQTRHALNSLPLTAAEVASAIDGVERVYKAGRLAFREARSRTDNALHEWRKQAKYLLNQIELIRALFGVKMKSLHLRTEALASVLGDDHDLAVFTTQLEAQSERSPALEKVIKRRRHRLQAQAFRIGKEVYRHSPSRVSAQFAQRLSRLRK
jgi:CHAD domain-containing protein